MPEIDYKEKDLKELAKDWLERIQAADKRESDWQDEATCAEDIYLCKKDSKNQTDFNIVYSMVETTVPAIYNSTPNPDVRPRFNMSDPVLKVVADIYERSLMAQMDDDKVDAEVEKLAQDAVLAGRGVIRVRFHADVDGESITNERLTYENVSWRDYREGPAKRAGDVPWRAFRHTVTLKEMRRISDDAVFELQTSADDTDADAENEDVDVWEIWCRDTGKVYFVVDEISKVLKIEDDPLGLKNFYPCPDPVQPVTGTGQRTPVCPYSAYKRLAEELDRITRRINKIMSGLKVRGFIAASAEDIAQLAESEDNTLVPIPNIEGLAATGGLDRAIMWWPVEQAAQVLMQLYQQRDQTKNAIYEITGISDIVRGQSDPNETAAAQRIKTQWGSQRVKRLQRMVQSHIRDLFVISAEIMASKFRPEELIHISGVQVQEEMLPHVAGVLAAPLDHYRIDVESDSTIRADLTMRRGEMAEFLQGTAAFFGTMAPVVKDNPASAVPAAEIYAAFARQFSLGKQAEDAIDQMADMAKQQADQGAPEGEQPDPVEMAKLQMQQQLGQQRHEREMMNMQLKAKELELQQMKMMQDSHFKGLETQLDAGELELKAHEMGREDDAQDFDQMKEVAELQMEREQRRPVQIGGY